MSQVSEDIFFQVKKEILDKLDVILQKINLQIINYVKPHEDQFNFIELSFFEDQITSLFGYLDRLYASLNSSVSFSSIQTIKEEASHNQLENMRLLSENQKLRSKVVQLDSYIQKGINPPLYEKDSQLQMRLTKQSVLEPLIIQTKAIKSEVDSLSKDVKKQLKGYRFQFLQARIELISRLKEWQSYHQNTKYGDGGKSNNNGRRCSEEELGCFESDHLQGCQEILETVNQILSIC